MLVQNDKKVACQSFPSLVKGKDSFMSNIYKKFLDTSQELLIYRHGNGIKLVRPEDAYRLKSYPNSYYTGHTVGSCLNFQSCIYFGNMESKLQNMNEGNAKAIGCQSIRSAIGKDAYAFLKKGNARRIIQHDIEIMMANKTIISEEDIILKNDDVRSNAIIVKSPWYDYDGHTIGTFACSLVVDAQPITSFLEELSQLSLLSSNHSVSQENNVSLGSQIDGVYLSKREAEVLQQMTFGKSARAAGEALSISQRTVETHLVHIKKKLKIRSKAELIDKAIYAFYGK